MSHGSASSDNEVSALITIWGDENIQDQLDGATRNKAIFETIAKKLQESGYNRDWQQCRAKLKNLKKLNTKKIKDHNGVTGNGRKTFKFYNKLDEILGHRPSSAPAFLVDTGSPSHGTTTTAQLQESDAEGGTDGKGEHIYKAWMVFTSTNVKLQIQAMCSPIFSPRSSRCHFGGVRRI
jgi:hypothetical protein